LGERGVTEWFVVVGRQGWEEMLRAIQKLCPCQLPIEDTVHLELAVVREGLSYFVYGKNKGAATILLCDLYQCSAHGMLEATLDFTTI
jgi:hypothetical protein